MNDKELEGDQDNNRPEGRKFNNRYHSKFITFQGYLTAERGEPNEDQIEIRTHVMNLTLRCYVPKAKVNEEVPDWYGFQAMVDGVIYYIDEKTFRRLLSCMNARNS